MVVWAGDIRKNNIKVGELQPQYLPTLHFYGLRLVEVVRIVVRDTRDCEVLSTIAAAVVLTFVVAVQLSRESAVLARSCWS